MNLLWIATKNKGKAKEFADFFTPYGLTIKTLNDLAYLPDIEETGTTFMENALLKAQQLSDYLNAPVLADDSGLCVDDLSGAPGIYSARYAGVHGEDVLNNVKLLLALAGVPDEKRTAHFHCALALAHPQKDPLTVEGIWSGRIVRQPKGTDGFGYDPLFFIPELNKTAAELTTAEKNQYSHRYLALAQLKEVWQGWWI